MSAILQPVIQTYLAGGTILKGHAVKMSDAQTVVEATGNTDKGVGIAQGDASSGALVEVAMPGGGAKAKAQTTIAVGDLLTSHSDGTLKPTTTANDRVYGVAIQDGVAGDLVSVAVQLSNV